MVYYREWYANTNQLKSSKCSFSANAVVPSMLRTEAYCTALSTLPLTISEAEAQLLLRPPHQHMRSCLGSGSHLGEIVF